MRVSLPGPSSVCRHNPGEATSGTIYYVAGPENLYPLKISQLIVPSCADNCAEPSGATQPLMSSNVASPPETVSGSAGMTAGQSQSGGDAL